jgi:hypothetical protein
MALGWLDRPASALRFQLATGTDGLMRYTVQVTQRGLSALRVALGAYDQLEVCSARSISAPMSPCGCASIQSKSRVASPANQPAQRKRSRKIVVTKTRSP